MMLKLRLILSGAALCALITTNAATLQAATILKLNLGGIGPDLSMTGGGFLGTADDGIVATTGDQNTAIEYTGFLEPIPDLGTATASFTLGGLTAAGPATVVPMTNIVLQDYTGGSFSLYDDSNTLLLSGTLTTSNLNGTLGAPGVGGYFTTGIASVTGGVLEDLILPGTLDLSMNLTNINGGAGLALSQTGGTLAPFNSDAQISISADPSPTGENFPEPGSFVLAAIGLAAAGVVRRRAG